MVGGGRNDRLSRIAVEISWQDTITTQFHKCLGGVGEADSMEHPIPGCNSNLNLAFRYLQF